MRRVRPLVVEVCLESGFSKKETHNIVLAVDEACTNIMKHSYQGDPKGLITLECRGGEKGVEFTLKDRGLPVNKAEIKHRALDKIRPGGLGVFFIKQMMDRVSYQKVRGVNILRMRKYGKKRRV